MKRSVVRRLFARLIPSRVKRVMEDRIFYVIFNSSRVTNDAYGWRPDSKEE